MNENWTHQEHQLERMTTQSQRYLATFRWLWSLNLIAAIVGVITHRYELTFVAAASSLVALVGVALARMGRTTLSEVTVECHTIRENLETDAKH